MTYYHNKLSNTVCIKKKTPDGYRYFTIPSCVTSTRPIDMVKINNPLFISILDEAVAIRYLRISYRNDNEMVVICGSKNIFFNHDKILVYFDTGAGSKHGEVSYINYTSLLDLIKMFI